MRVAIYARVSTSKQENENQLAELREFASKQGWEVVQEFVDTVTGSGKKERPAFNEMMLQASQRRFDVVCFWAIDRLSRAGTRETLRILTQLDAWGVAFRSYTQPYFDSCGIMRDVVISVMSTLAQQERISISERTKAGLRRVRRQGVKLGRPVADIDMRKVQKLRADGLSLRAVADKLDVSAALLCKRLAQ